MAVTRTDHNEVFTPAGRVSDTTVQRDVTADQLRVEIKAALADLQTIIDSPDLAAGTLTGAQLSQAARQLQTAAKMEARIIRKLIREAVRDYTDTA